MNLFLVYSEFQITRSIWPHSFGKLFTDYFHICYCHLFLHNYFYLSYSICTGFQTFHLFCSL